jgi:Fe-S-cluster containining protein
MTKLKQILDNYATLCRYCDSVFAFLQNQYGRDMACRKGCSACCELHSVCALEAHAVAASLAKKTPPRMRKRKNRSRCVLCVNGECAVYPTRPVICRTHGVPLFLDKGKTVASSCRLNFTGRDLAALPSAHVLDTAALTGNLMRLNIAFCMVAGRRELASERFTMADVLAGDIPESILMSKV